MKNRKLLLIISVVLALTMSLGGTLAYLTDTDADVNVMTIGNVNIVQNEQQRGENGLEQFDTTVGHAMYPVTKDPMTGYHQFYDKDWNELESAEGAEYSMFDTKYNFVDKIVTVTNTGNTDAFVRTIFAFEMKKVGDNWVDPVDSDVKYCINNRDIEWVKENNDEYVTIDIGNVKYIVGQYYYDGDSKLAPKETTPASLTQVYLKSEVGNEWYEQVGETYEIRVLSQAVQAAGFGTAAEALDEAFGALTVANATEWFNADFPTAGSPGTENDTNNPPVFGVAVTPDNIGNIDFTAPGKNFELAGNFGDVMIDELGEGSVISFDNATVGTLTVEDDAVLEGVATIDKINVVRNSTEPITVTLREANFNVVGEISVKNTDGKSVLNIENSQIKAATIFVGEHTNNERAALAELNIINSYVSCEENGLGSTIGVWGRSGVKATIYDSEIYTYSRGWHQSEDANDNSITFQGATSIDVDIQRSNMHLYGARSIIYARQYGSEATTIKTNVEDSLIWVVTKSSHGENTLPVWGFDENNINDSILLFTKNVHQSTPAVFKSFVYGNPTIHGDYHVTTQCQWDAPIALADGQTVTFASDANVSIYEGAGKVAFVKDGSAKVVLETGATVENISGIN